MQKQIIVLNGIIYDYCEETRFYRILGILDHQTGTFEGIEFVTNHFETLEKTKESLSLLDPMARIVTGFLNGNIQYSVLDMEKGTIDSTVLKPFGNDSFYGHTHQEELFTGRMNSEFKTASSIQTIQDIELQSQIEKLISCQQKNFIFRRLQANIKNAKEKVLTF